MLLTVRKEGPNTGRQFYKCPKPQGGGSCDFFLWADASNTGPSAPTPSASYSRGAGDTTSFRQPTFQNQQRDENSEVCCECGETAKQLTVQKEGPNQGRQFYTCAKPRDAQCRFFQWGDDSGGSGGGYGQDSNERFSGGARYDGGSRGRGRGRGRGRANESLNNEPRRARKCGSCGQEGKTQYNQFLKIFLYSLFFT